jgi:riboflavin kinase/FMN adenylyltransferase
MQIHEGLSAELVINNPVVTTGTFDGVHLGHQKIINRLNQIADGMGGESVLLSFYPHPRMVLFPDDNEMKLLNTQDEKAALLEKYGIKHLFIIPFTKEFSRTSSLDFVRDVIINKIGTKKLVIGYNHHFGRNRQGSFEQLNELAPLYGFEVEEIPAIDVDSIEVSSTKIRNALLQGDIKNATTYLGHHFTISGKVVKGKQLGRTLNMPTANIEVADKYKLIPAKGIYAVTVKLKNELLKGVMSIGNNPTVNGKAQTIEVNIFDFDKDIYNDYLEVNLVERLRDELKFDSIEELKTQMQKDKEQAQKLLA